MTGLLGQLEAFVLTLVLGLLTGTIFHFYQKVIRLAQVSRMALYILDFFLWIIIIGLVFLSMLFINQGEMRVYVLIALLLGILIYYRWFASRFNRIITPLAHGLVKVCSFIASYIKRALKWLITQIARLKPRPKEPPESTED